MNKRGAFIGKIFEKWFEKSSRISLHFLAFLGNHFWKSIRKHFFVFPSIIIESFLKHLLKVVSNDSLHFLESLLESSAKSFLKNIIETYH